MPAPDTYRPSSPPRQGQGQNRPAPKPRLTPQQEWERDFRKELTFSISLQRMRDAVDHGWMCAWHQANDYPYVAGYLVGLDREYFVVFEPTTVWDDEKQDKIPIVREHLLSRGQNLAITIHPEKLIVDEPSYTQMSERYEKYRAWMVTTHAKGPNNPTATPSRTGQSANRDVPRNVAPPPGATMRGPYSPTFSDTRRA